MTQTEGYLLAATHARDAGYDVLLLAHVLAAAVGLGAVVIAGANAMVLRRSGPGSEAIRRYYRPGVNWAGKVLFLVPVLGLALMALSHGDWSFSDGWIMVGLGLWAVVAVVAEMYLWPAERRLQGVVSVLAPVEDDSLAPVEEDRGRSDGAGPGSTAVEGTTGASTPTGSMGDAESGARARAAMGPECLRVAGFAASLAVVLVVVAVIMVAKP